MQRILWLLFKFVSYLALLIVAAGIASLVLVFKLDVCPRLDEGGITCVTPFYEQIASFGVGVALATVFTGLPGLLAIAGVVFLVRDLLSLARRKA